MNHPLVRRKLVATFSLEEDEWGRLPFGTVSLLENYGEPSFFFFTFISFVYFLSPSLSLFFSFTDFHFVSRNSEELVQEEI